MMLYSLENISFSLILVCVFIFDQDVTATRAGPSHGKLVVCYYATYADHRPGRGKFQLEDFNPALCTHLVYAFALLNETDQSIYLLAPWSDLEVDKKDNKNNIAKLKSTYPHLKVTVSIGGWQDGSVKYSNMAADPYKRKKFVNSTLSFIREHSFDGMDLVWQYPAKRGGSRQDKSNFAELVKELREAYDKHNLLLTASLDSSKDTIDYGYDVPQLSKYLHYMLVMCYDYNGAWSRFTGHNAPLYNDDLLNVAYTINYFLKVGADPNKIIMGIPLFGRTFITEDPIDLTKTLPGLQQKFKNYTFAGPFTQEDGYLGYNEICLDLRNSSLGWKTYWDDFTKTPFAINGDKFITFDNITSIKEKITFLIKKNLRGVLLWSVDTDDFRGDCQEEVEGHMDYPLLRSINKELNALSAIDAQNSLQEDEVKAVSVRESKGYELRVNCLMILFTIKLIYFLNG